MRHEGGRRGFRPDIEGLRAIAVLAVVLYHAGLPGLPGGFVGVDVFFVISGFLITGMLWREIEGSGRVRLARFYGARARRLLPAGMLVLVASALAAARLLPPLEARTELGDAVASALYVGNYRLALRGTDYLADTSPSVFQHYWSLGVEEQFYLVWPGLLILTACLVHRRRGGGRSVWPYVGVLGVVAGVSLAVSLVWTTSSPSWAFFSLPSRAWELSVGGLVALTARWWSGMRAPEAVGAGAAGLALVGVSYVWLDGSVPFPGLAALAPVLGTALVIASGCAGPRWGAHRLLGLRPLRAIGRISYSWYLWHWPVLLLAPALLGHPLGLLARLATAAVSGVLAVVTVVAVEDRVRFAAALKNSAGRSLALGGAATAFGVCAALVAVALVPTTVGTGRAVAAPAIGAAATARVPAAASADPKTAAVQSLTAQVQSAVAASAHLGAVPSNLTPALAQVKSDVQQPWQDGCVLGYTEVGLPACSYGDPGGVRTVELIGDSHAAAWEPALDAAGKQQHFRLVVRSKALCPMIDQPMQNPFLHREFTECERWRGQVLDDLRAHPPALVVVAMARRYGADFGFASYDPTWLAGLTREVTTLRGLGAPVLVLGAVPDPHSWVPNCVSQHLGNAAACAAPRQAALNGEGMAAEKAATAAGGGRYVDVSELFCTTDVCPAIVGNQLVFRDDNHLTPEYAAFLSPVMAAVIATALPGS